MNEHELHTFMAVVMGCTPLGLLRRELLVIWGNPSLPLEPYYTETEETQTYICTQTQMHSQTHPPTLKQVHTHNTHTHTHAYKKAIYSYTFDPFVVILLSFTNSKLARVLFVLLLVLLCWILFLISVHYHKEMRSHYKGHAK